MDAAPDKLSGKLRLYDEFGGTTWKSSSLHLESGVVEGNQG